MVVILLLSEAASQSQQQIHSRFGHCVFAKHSAAVRCAPFCKFATKANSGSGVDCTKTAGQTSTATVPRITFVSQATRSRPAGFRGGAAAADYHGDSVRCSTGPKTNAVSSSMRTDALSIDIWDNRAQDRGKGNRRNRNSAKTGKKAMAVAFQREVAPESIQLKRLSLFTYVALPKFLPYIIHRGMSIHGS